MILLILSTLTFGAERHLVEKGETVESLAQDLGDAALAESIRSLNGLGPTEQPTIGRLLTLPATSSSDADQDAFLTSTTGEATIQLPNKPVEPATLFSPLPIGTEVCTAIGAFASLRLATQCDTQGTRSDDIVLDPETCVVVESAHANEKRRSTVITVTKGAVSVDENDAPGAVTILTNAGATSGGKGGYRVTVEEGATRTEALYGDVAVTGMGAQVDVNEGQGSRTVEGQAPSPAVDLLAPGNPAAPEVGAVLRRPSFAWSTVEGALGYRMEIATDAQFLEVVYQEDSPEPLHEPALLLLPTHERAALWWRVSSFDRMGFLGVPSPPRHLRFPEGIAP